jgi:hypothetical protein
VKYGFDSADQNTGDANPSDLPHDLTLEVEYARTSLLEKPVQHEIYETLEPHDNIVVEEYSAGLISKRTIHRIVEIRRGDSILFSAAENVALVNPTKIERERAARETKIETLLPYIVRYLKDGAFDDAILRDAKKFKKFVVDQGWNQTSLTLKLRVERTDWDCIFGIIEMEIARAAENQPGLVDEIVTKLPEIVRKAIAPGTTVDDRLSEGELEVGGDAVSNKLASILKTQLQALKKIGTETLQDEQKYKACVVDPLWEALPLPVRLLGRDRLRWDTICNALKTTIFIVDKNEVRINTKGLSEIPSIVKKILGQSSS